MTFPAHIRSNDGHVQTVTEHCQKVSEYAGEILKKVGLQNCGQMCGLIHDMGKFCIEFSDYITRASQGEAVRRGSVNHTFAGVRLLFEKYSGTNAPPMQKTVCEILAFSVGSHHGQFDCIDPNGSDGFSHRLCKEGIHYLEAKTNFFQQCVCADGLDQLFKQAEIEIQQILTANEKYLNNDELWFFISLICRLILSALIDGDRHDTAEFMSNLTFDEPFPDMRSIWEGRLNAVESRLLDFPVNSPVDKARRKISEQCRAFENRGSGVYRLSVPTGSGKTLSGLRAALAHAAKQEKSRIFFVTPLLSVLDQNAKCIRDYIGSDNLILEHHSNVLRINNDNDELDENELLIETWHSPVVITTLVQFLNTLFDGSTSSIRRMNALINSVIVIDEVQSVPRNMLSQFNMAINFLTTVCNATVLLCSATQPCLEKTNHPIKLAESADLVPYNPEIWKPFSRTKIFDKRRREGYSTEELSSFALEKIPQVESLLIICNMKKQAETLYNHLKNSKFRTFHLSTSMCMEHRIKTLAKIKDMLADGEPVICVSTQLVEAGVDFSFGCVIRVCAGMDSIVQAAGRCNRSGEFEKLCPVYIVNFKNENLRNLKEIKETQTATEELLASFRKNSEIFDNNLQSGKSIHYYYNRLFLNMPETAQDYWVPKYKTSLCQMLSRNDAFRPNNCQRVIGQAFKTAGKEFEVFDSPTTDVLVPYGEGKTLIEDFGTFKANSDFLYRKHLMNKAKGFSVSLFDYQINALTKSGGLHSLCDGAVLVALSEFYSDETGINILGNNNSFLEV